jgi:predicted  nucleic acid-binding Zn-ribbon protein
MPHQCVHCSRIIPVASKELLEGCQKCGGHFFYYVKDEQMAMIKERNEKPEEINVIPHSERKQIEQDIREMAGIVQEDVPVILDLESVRVNAPGKFEIDLVSLFRKDRPIVYKLSEGKYIIDLSSTLKSSVKDLKEIRKVD